MFILGFGAHHVERSRAQLRELLDAIAGAVASTGLGCVCEVAEVFAMSQGKTELRSGYLASNFSIRDVNCLCNYGAYVVVVEGLSSHYRLDHPLSPDGCASWSLPFCVTYATDDVWGERKYLSLM